MTYREEIGSQLKQLRLSCELTLQQLADLTGYTKSNLAKIERGAYNVSIDILSNILHVLGARLSIGVCEDFPLFYDDDNNPDLIDDNNDDSDNYINTGDDRFILQQSADKSGWVVTDVNNGIVCQFEHRKFNETQKFTVLNDIKKPSAIKPEKLIHDMWYWLADHHRDKIE